MSYPNLPKNRLLIKLSDDKLLDLTEEFKMILIDDYTLEPPEPKTYMIEIPGGNGKLDLTESLLGDTVYNNRKQEFTFNLIDVENFEKMKTKISNLLHGKEFDYQLTMDPGYTYHGRFTVSGYSHKMYSSGVLGSIKISIDANPFKYLKPINISVDAIGGKVLSLECGRKRVRPTIVAKGFVKIIYDGKLLTLPQGSWVVNDLLLTDGSNELYVNSYDIRNLTWGEMKSNGITWGEFGKKELYLWYKSNGDRTYVVKDWSSVKDSKWSDMTSTRWIDLMYLSDITRNIENVEIQYEWGDL